MYCLSSTPTVSLTTTLSHTSHQPAHQILAQRHIVAFAVSAAVGASLVRLSLVRQTIGRGGEFRSAVVLQGHSRMLSSRRRASNDDLGQQKGHEEFEGVRRCHLGRCTR